MKLIKKIKDKFRKKQAWEKADVSPLIENGVLLLNVPYTYEQFTRVCVRAADQNLEFDRIMVTHDCYISLYNDLIKMIPPELKVTVFKTPLTEEGHQALEGIRNPITGQVVKLYAIKPEKYTIVN